MKKIVSILVSIMLLTGMIITSAYAYDLPTPDWGALLREKTSMVMEQDFELYVEGGTESAPYYGAKFEPRSGVYIGMTADTLNDYKPLGSYLTYIESYYQNDLYYPSNSMIRQDDVITMVGWNVTSINNVDYDAVDRTLNMLDSYNKPMFVRFANEMNCSNLGDDPELYVEVFRNVANLVHKYSNLAVVWSPNDIGALDKLFEYYYPGDEYVDWIGVSCYTKKYFNNNPNTTYNDSIYFMTGDFSWATNKVKPIVEFMQKNNINKPLMLSEGGVATNNTFGDSAESNAAWNIPRMRNMYWNLIMKYPQIKMINYFNVRRNYETEWYDISDYSYASDIFNEAASSGAYIRSLNGSPDFVYSKAENGDILAAKDGIVNLYTLAYIPQTPDISVNYKIDGIWFHSANQIPYKCRFDINSVTDGEHTLTIETSGLSKSYTFTKNGQNMRFGDNAATTVPSQIQTPQEDRLTNNVRYTKEEKEITVVIKKNSGEMETIEFDQKPIIEDGRTLVPMRAIFEALGMRVSWDDTSKTVTASNDNMVITMTIGDNVFYKNDDRYNVRSVSKKYTLDVPAKIYNRRTLVPVRAIAESLNADVDWDGDSRTVIISNYSAANYGK